MKVNFCCHNVESCLQKALISNTFSVTTHMLRGKLSQWIIKWAIFQLHLSYKRILHMLLMKHMYMVPYKITNHLFCLTEIISNNLYKTTFILTVVLYKLLPMISAKQNNGWLFCMVWHVTTWLGTWGEKNCLTKLFKLSY